MHFKKKTFQHLNLFQQLPSTKVCTNHVITIRSFTLGKTFVEYCTLILSSKLTMTEKMTEHYIK